ncbi:MAG: Fur family transcriptional regulator [bacterium]|nr:transcriptional repressor [Planctomycetota bacterium]HIL51565.1 transcriptional repressor [Planctomycetota bacterium]
MAIMDQTAIRKRFGEYLHARSLKLTGQRDRIFERAFETHEHFTPEALFDWLREAEGTTVSRATVYRTLTLLEEGGFIVSMNNGLGDVVYEHILGHEHHDHIICLKCGRIDEFQNTEIEALQIEVARTWGYSLVRHTLRLEGVCGTCRLSGAETG